MSVFRDLDDVIFLYTAQARRFEKSCLKLKKKRTNDLWTIIFSMKIEAKDIASFN